MVNILPAVIMPAVVNEIVWSLDGFRSIFELSARSKEEKVSVLVAVMSEVPSIPPFMISEPGKLVLTEGFNLNSPAVIVVFPV